MERPSHFHREHVGVKATAAAGVTHQVHRAEVAHAHFQHPGAFAGLAAPAGRVEGEVSLAHTEGLGLGGGGKEVAQGIERPCVGRRVGAGRAADRVGVHRDDAAEGAFGAQREPPPRPRARSSRPRRPR